MEQVCESARLLDFEQNLTSDTAIAHLCCLLLGCILLGDLSQAMQLDYRGFEGTTKNNSGVRTLRKQSVEAVLILVDATDFKEALELDVCYLRYFALFSSLWGTLFLRRWLVCLEVDLTEYVKEGRNRLSIVLQLEIQLVF